MFFEPFASERETCFIPVEQFEFVLLFIAKNKQRASKRIDLYLIFNDGE